jgi:hypothetical protein
MYVAYFSIGDCFVPRNDVRLSTSHNARVFLAMTRS